MKIFLNGEFNASNISFIFPNAKKYLFNLKGYASVYYEQKAYIIKDSSSSVDGYIVELGNDSIWKLDQWKDVLISHRILMQSIGAYYYKLYYNNGDNAKLSSSTTIKDFFHYSHSSIKHADLHLFIPGFRNKKHSIKSHENDYLGEFLNNCIKQECDWEYNNEFIKNNSRFSLGICEIATYFLEIQRVSITILSHNETDLCIIDIFIPNVIISPHRILQDFCHNKIKIRQNGEFNSTEDFFQSINFYPRGTRRSIIFCYENVNEENLLNLLVNEERPMAKISSSFFRGIAHNNIAQYDSARVYVSETTMVEIIENMNIDLESRIKNQSLEIFFVELLLLQDAAISKLSQHIQSELSKERISPYRLNSSAVIDALLNEWSSVIRFSDYKQFYFPTVRVSAENIANAFGIKHIVDNYEQNKMILENMIERHSNARERQNAILTNGLLMVISIVSTFTAIYQTIIILLGESSKMLSLYITIALTLVAFIVYIIFYKLKKLTINKIHKNKTTLYE